MPGGGGDASRAREDRQLRLRWCRGQSPLFSRVNSIGKQATIEKRKNAF